MPRRRPDRFPLALLGAVFFASAGLAGCGSGGPGNAVVQIGGQSITKETLNHWMTVASASSASSTGAKARVPEPPGYTACIASAKAAAKPAKGQKPPTAAQLKSQCEQEYKSLQQEVLGFLISSSWVSGEAGALGVKVSGAEVKKQFEKIKSQQFPKAAEFAKFLATSGESVSDLLLRVKLNLLSAAIQQKIVKQKSKVSQAEIAKYYNEDPKRFAKPGSQQTLKQAEPSIKSQLTATQQQTALSTFVKNFKKKWKAKTDCHAGYVVADCRQYIEPKAGSPGAIGNTPAG
jgi:foldase protein PrsA